LAEIRAAGDPVTLADLARPPIPPEKNAATYLRRAQADLTAIEKDGKNLHSASECPAFMIPLDDRKIIKAAFLAHPNVIPLLEQAAACPDYDAELDYTVPPLEFDNQLLDLANTSRSPARVLCYRSALLVAEGKRDEAVRTALLILRLARHLDRNPMLVNNLVAIAVRWVAIESANEALQTGPISKEVRGSLDVELAIQQHMQGYSWSLKSERSHVVASFRNIIPLRNFWLISRGMWNMQESACLETFPAVIALAGEPDSYRETNGVISRIYGEISQKTSPLAALLMPALRSQHDAVTRVRAMIRCLRVLNALQTHVLAGSNEVPKLTDLGLPAEAITDPFNGQPLHVKKTPRGWLVYSVGLNLQDDAGKIDDVINGDVGVGPPPPAP